MHAMSHYTPGNVLLPCVLWLNHGKQEPFLIFFFIEHEHTKHAYGQSGCVSAAWLVGENLHYPFVYMCMQYGFTISCLIFAGYRAE